MSLRRSEERRSTGGPLKDISHRQLLGLARIQNPVSASKVQLSSYIEENHQLRIKCAKIDEIENCANILMENIEKYKRWNAELEGKVAQLMSDNEKLRNQVYTGANIKILKEENLRKEGELAGLRKKMEMNDNLQLIRMQQQVVSEKQARERMIGNLESKHKSQLSKLEHQLKISINKLEHENQMLRAQTENIVKETAHLKTNLSEAEGNVRKLSRQNERLQNELVRAQDIMVQSQDELNMVNHNFADFKLNADQRISSLAIELEKTRAEFQKSLSVQSMLERMNAQLKNEGATLILQNQDMKAHTLELEQINLINLSNIKNLQQQIASMNDSNSYFQAKIVDKQMANKQVLDGLQRDNILLHKAIGDRQSQILTKRKEIDDLIMIVSRLQADLKVTTSTVTALEQTNGNVIQQLRVKDQKIDNQAIQINTLIAKLQALEAYRNDTQPLLDMQQDAERQLDQERQKTNDLQSLLELQRNRLSQMQLLKQRLSGELAEKEKINQSWKDGKEQYQKMYHQQKSQNILYKERIQQLEALSNQLQNLARSSEQQKAQLYNKFQAEKTDMIKEGMEQMEKLISVKYDEILKEYQRHYDEKVKALEQEVTKLKDQIASSEH